MNAPSRTNWSGVAFGVTLGALAAYQQFKLPPALPLLFEQFGYSKLLAGGFMSVYALVGLIFSVLIGRLLTRGRLAPLLTTAYLLMLAGNTLALTAPHIGSVMLMSRLMEGSAFAILAINGAVIAASSATVNQRPLAIGLWQPGYPWGRS